MSKVVRRLYYDFHPDHYDLELRPDKETMKFSGDVRVQGQKVSRPAKRLILHQRDLKVTSASIIYHDKKGDTPIEVTRINHHNGFDEVRLHTDKLLYPGKYTITLEFQGVMTDPMNGIYPCYFTYQGKDEKLIATQFESHHAREAFPCIDEPEAKATFNLTLSSPLGETVISNTPIELQIEQDKKLFTKFEKTPRMSTYLLAFVIGKMGYKEAKTKDGVLMRVYATPDNVGYGTFSLETAIKILEFYNEYFGIPYPLPKCDFVALPDFSAGAMENWGCITFREQTLLVDAKNTSLTIKQHVAVVIAHELAHQWFGNLVTMKWWTDLWLNEGFASWIEYLAVDHVFPKWEMWTQFAIDDHVPAMSLDALSNSHPVEIPINHPDEIRSAFDTISYAKGSSVIQMLYTYIGPEGFRSGLHKYLTEHAYGNTETKDLWAALELATKKPVSDFMHTWITQTGFPYVQAEIGESSLLLSQERFLINAVSRKKITEHTVWPVPLLSREIDMEIFDKAEISVPVLTNKTIMLNEGQSGFYRVGYNPEHLAKLANLVLRDKLSPLDRFGLLSDAFESAKAGFIPTIEALDLLNSYRHEDNVVVWELIVANIGALRAIMNDEQLRHNIKPFIIKIIDEQLQRLGWEEKPHESHFDKLLRPIILGLAASADEPNVLKKIHRQFAAMKTGEDIHPDFRAVIYVTAARKGGVKEFNKLLGLYRTTLNSEERVTLAIALTSFKQPALIVRALDLIDTDLVKLQDVFYWVAYSFSNRHAKVATWEWMVSHWAWLEKNLGTDVSFYRFPVYAATPFGDTAFLPVYKKFFKKVATPALERAINQGVEIIQWESAWRTRDIRSVKKYFKRSD